MSRWLPIIAMVWLVACSNPDDHNHPDLWTGEDFYRYHCAACHRDAGRGDFLKGVPPAIYASLDAESFIALILEHQRPPTTRMPIFENMPRDEAKAIADYLQANIQHAHARSGETTSSPSDPR